MTKKTTMTSGSIWKSILLFSIPLILGNLLQQLYNTMDSIIVGKFLGTNALAAVGSSGSLIALIIAFNMGASAGAGVLIAQYYGANDEQNLQKVVHTILGIGILLGVITSIVGLAFSPLLLTWMKTPKEVMTSSILYLRLYFAGSIFNVLYNMCAGILNAVGNSKRSLIYLGIASFSNIILDLLFIDVFKMGVAGAAIATDISQLLSCIFILRFLFSVKDTYRAAPKKICLDPSMSLKIIQIGLPTAIQNIVISLSNVLIQSGVNSFGPSAMAGFAAYIKVDGFNILPVMSFSLAATTFTGQNVGAGKMDRVRKGMWSVLAMSVLYTALISVIMLSFPRQLIAIFDQNPEVINYGIKAIWCLAPFYSLLGIMHSLAGTIRGTGNTVQPMAIILFALCVFRVFWLKFATPHFDSIIGVFIVYPISFVLGVSLMSLYAWKGKWMQNIKS